MPMQPNSKCFRCGFTVMQSKGAVEYIKATNAYGHMEDYCWELMRDELKRLKDENAALIKSLIRRSTA